MYRLCELFDGLLAVVKTVAHRISFVRLRRGIMLFAANALAYTLRKAPNTFVSYLKESSSSHAEQYIVVQDILM